MTKAGLDPVPLYTLNGAVYEVCAAYEETDQTEGRSPARLLGYFHSAADAEEAAKGKGIQGSTGRIDRIHLFSADGGKTGVQIGITQGATVKIMPAGYRLRREQALAKLSWLDREVLGLN